MPMSGASPRLTMERCPAPPEPHAVDGGELHLERGRESPERVAVEQALETLHVTLREAPLPGLLVLVPRLARRLGDQACAVPSALEELERVPDLLGDVHLLELRAMLPEEPVEHAAREVLLAAPRELRAHTVLGRGEAGFK